MESTSTEANNVKAQAMKTLSLVECIELKFTGVIMKEALALGDVDNDGVSELVVGNTDGDLFIYKDGKCICRAFDLGCVAAVAVGDLLNINKNVTVVITTEGYCHVFDVEEEILVTAQQQQPPPDPSVASLGGNNNYFVDAKVIQQFHSQRIMANTKAMFLADVNDDGQVELVCGLTDRVLRTYKWNPDSVPELEALSPQAQFTVFDGRIQAVNKWELTHQIGSIAAQVQDDVASIIIGTGGGTVTRVTEVSPARKCRLDQETDFNSSMVVGSAGCRLERNDSIEKDLIPGTDPNSSQNSASTYAENIIIKRYPLNSSRMRNQNISTHVAGNVASHDGCNMDSYAVGTWDGTIMICKDDNIEWNMQLNKPVMTVQSFAGNALFVDMEGPTYLINRRLSPQMQNCIVRFYFEDQVAAFRVGWYGMRRANCGPRSQEIVNQKCFVYATFQGSIYVYPNNDYL